MTNNTFTTTPAPAPVQTRIEMLNHNINANRRELKFNSFGRLEIPLTAEEITEKQTEIAAWENQLRGIYFMLQELSLHA